MDRVRFRRLPTNPDLPLPERATEHAAGYDVRSAETSVTLEPGVTVDARVLRSGTQRLLVYHWYMGTDGFASEVVRSLLALDASPYRRPQQGVAVRLTTDLAGPERADRRRAEIRLRRFFDTIRSELGSLGGQVGQWKRFSRISPSGKSVSAFRSCSVNSVSIKSAT